MTISLKYLSSLMDPMNLESKSNSLRPVVIVAISLLLCLIISMTTLLSTTPITSFRFFSEPMFSNHFSFHMSGNDNIAHCTDSLDAGSKLSANLDSEKEGMKHSGSISNENLHMMSKENLLMMS
ncbi:hypothetical protein AHAS_Ahas12G0085500 [Arachis hypogaea]